MAPGRCLPRLPLDYLAEVSYGQVELAQLLVSRSAQPVCWGRFRVPLDCCGRQLRRFVVPCFPVLGLSANQRSWLVRGEGRAGNQCQYHQHRLAGFGIRQHWRLDSHISPQRLICPHASREMGSEAVILYHPGFRLSKFSRFPGDAVPAWPVVCSNQGFGAEAAIPSARRSRPSHPGRHRVERRGRHATGLRCSWHRRSACRPAESGRGPKAQGSRPAVW